MYSIITKGKQFQYFTVYIYWIDSVQCCDKCILYIWYITMHIFVNQSLFTTYVTSCGTCKVMSSESMSLRLGLSLNLPIINEFSKVGRNGLEFMVEEVLLDLYATSRSCQWCQLKHQPMNHLQADVIVIWKETNSRIVVKFFQNN